MKLTKTQEDAINHTKGPALILAVPGSGKTTVLIHRTNRLITQENIDPRRILSITFSKASAQDMMNRYNLLFPNDIQPRFSTIHSFCFNIIRDYGIKTNTRFILIENPQARINKYDLIKEIYYQINKDYITEDEMESLLNYFGFIKNMMLTVDVFLENYDIDVRNFKRIYQSYGRYKRQNNLLDFDDMLTLTLEILWNNPSILREYQNKFDYIQVDEGQDTSKIQLEIIKLLGKTKNNIFIVADDDQSIYGFRGAYPEGLLNFEKHFPNSKIFYMEENFRSSKNIVTTSNEFIKANKIRYNKNIFTNNKSHKNIKIENIDDSLDQYHYIIDDLKSKNINDSCILYRNNISSIGLVEILDRNNIPFNTREGNMKFFNHWVISDIFNFFRLAEDDSQVHIYEEIFYKTKGYISRKQINFAKKLNKDQSVFKRIQQYPGINYYYKTTLRELELDFRKLSKLKPAEAIVFIERDLEYLHYLKENSTKFGYTYDNLVRILFYLKIIAKNCNDFYELESRLNYIKKLYGSSNKNQGITLSTVHSAKGLEFENVYMIDLVEGEFPNDNMIDKDNNTAIEEERRLFYVAMTRAKKELHLLAPKFLDGERVYPSRFVEEVRESF